MMQHTITHYNDIAWYVLKDVTCQIENTAVMCQWIRRRCGSLAQELYENILIARQIIATALFRYKDGIILSYQYMGKSHIKGKTVGRTSFL